MGGAHGRGVHATHAPQTHEIWSVNVRVVCILLEFILVTNIDLQLLQSCRSSQPQISGESEHIF